MELKDLINYAKQTYHLKEEQWRGYPNLSMLRDPDTSCTLILLIRE